MTNYDKLFINEQLKKQPTLETKTTLGIDATLGLPSSQEIISYNFKQCNKEAWKILTGELKMTQLPKRIIQNKEATVFIDDDKKTVVKRGEREADNPRIAFLEAYFQHYSGLSKTQCHKYLDKLEKDYEEKLAKEKALKQKQVLVQLHKNKISSIKVVDGKKKKVIKQDFND